MYCQYCREQINAEARFCSHCGQAVQPPAAAYNWQDPFYGRLTRARYGRMIGGVCAGLANHYGWDPVIVRLIAVAGLIFGCGSFFVAYLVAWVIMPLEPIVYMPMQPPPAYTPPAPTAGGTTAS